MFLFTTPNRPEQAPQQVPSQVQSQQGDNPLIRPLKQAADETGISFDYLVKTAKRESNLNPEAKAANSSATGLFQFIEQTWLGLVKRQGPQLGLAEQANAIQQDRSGRYVVNEADTRQQILALRKDPTLSAKLAGVFTSENKASLKDALGREPSGGELYIAHFMGAGGARELISQAANNPEKSAASVFPDAASANRPIFFDGKGRARTTREVYARLVSFHDGADAAIPTAVAAAGAAAAPAPAGVDEMPTRSPLALAPARTATQTGQLREQAQFNGFFRSGSNQQAANALRKTWLGVAEARVNPNAPSFFPRADVAPKEVAKVAMVDLESVKPIAAAATDIPDPATSPLARFEAMQAYPSNSAYPSTPVYPAVKAPLPPVRPDHLKPADPNSPMDLTHFAGTRKR